ncbi:hypothetical protein [Paenibacillus sp. 8b26]|uniref:hypothetical protein n=1 Tax=Paenibacillus sp. 8b26 TaxID=3424133 RepID=UPI003D6569F2
MDERILNEFVKFLAMKKRLKVSTQEGYLTYIRHFIDIASSRNASDNIEGFFQEEIIRTFYNVKPSSISSAVLLAFSQFLYERKLIDRVPFLDINHRLLELKITPTRLFKTEFLSEKQVEFIRGERVYYRFIENPKRLDKEISIVGPVIWELALMGLEQKELISLTIHDLEVSHNRYRIRNLYREKNDLLSEWITLNSYTITKLIRYLEYRSKLSVKNEELLLIEGRPLDNRSINHAFSIFKRVENLRELQNSGEINAQLLVRTGILLSLLKTNGQGLIDIIRIFGLDNSQVSYSITEYLCSTYGK